MTKMCDKDRYCLLLVDNRKQDKTYHWDVQKSASLSMQIVYRQDSNQSFQSRIKALNHQNLLCHLPGHLLLPNQPVSMLQFKMTLNYKAFQSGQLLWLN